MAIAEPPQSGMSTRFQGLFLRCARRRAPAQYPVVFSMKLRMDRPRFVHEWTFFNIKGFMRGVARLYARLLSITQTTDCKDVAFAEFDNRFAKCDQGNV